MPALYGLQPRQAYYRTIDDRQDRMWTSSCGHSSVGLLPIGREAVHKLCSSSQASDAVSHVKIRQWFFAFCCS